MIPAEMQTVLAIAAVVIAAVGLVAIRRLVRRSVRDRPHDPDRVARMVCETDPAALDQILSDG